MKKNTMFIYYKPWINQIFVNYIPTIIKKMNKTIRELLGNTEFSDLIEKFENSGITKFFHFKPHLAGRTLNEFLKDIEKDNDRRLRLSGLLFKEYNKHEKGISNGVLIGMLVVVLFIIFKLFRAYI